MVSSKTGLNDDILNRDMLERYKIFAEKARDCFLFIDYESLGILDANNATVNTYGYSLEELNYQLSATIPDFIN